MEQSFLYGEIYWSTWRLLAISMSTVLVELSEQELSPLDWGQVKAVLKIAHSPGYLTQRERERVLAAELSPITATSNAMASGTFNSIFRLCVARIKNTVNVCILILENY